MSESCVTCTVIEKIYCTRYGRLCSRRPAHKPEPDEAAESARTSGSPTCEDCRNCFSIHDDTIMICRLTGQRAVDICDNFKEDE